MEEMRLAETELRFTELVWDKEPLTSGELVQLCEKELSWKKSTTYTVLRRVCQKGILQNEGGRVTSRMTRAEYEAICSEQFLRNNFDGSLPRFLAAFMSRKKLDSKQIAEIQQMIDSYEEEL